MGTRHFSCFVVCAATRYATKLNASCAVKRKKKKKKKKNSKFLTVCESLCTYLFEPIWLAERVPQLLSVENVMIVHQDTSAQRDDLVRARATHWKTHKCEFISKKISRFSTPK
jgi:hypothetical protein